jgi:hypothetical protein
LAFDAIIIPQSSFELDNLFLFGQQFADAPALAKVGQLILGQVDVLFGHRSSQTLVPTAQPQGSAKPDRQAAT